MNRFVPYLAEEAIESDAAALLAEFEREGGERPELPIPIEDIVEKHLGLSLNFDDLHARHNIPRQRKDETDILGAIYGDGSVFIDESLDPEENPSKEGRYRFTVAHEGGGHWRLHQHLIVGDQAQVSLFDNANEAKFLCRSSEAKRREEWQADFYASCLLMPPAHVREVWGKFLQGGEQHVMDRSRRDAALRIKDPKDREFEVGVEDYLNEEAMKNLVRPLARQFLVSPLAMRIRVEQLGLLHRDAPSQGSFAQSP